MPDTLDRLTTALADRYRIEHELGAGGMGTVYPTHTSATAVNSSTLGHSSECRRVRCPCNRRGALTLLHLSLVAAVLAVTAPAAAQSGKLTGWVTDARSGDPLGGVEIVLQGTGLSALTAANGRFFLLSVPPGGHVVVARRVGYQAVEIHNVIILLDLTRSLDVRLSPARALVTPTIAVTAEQVPLVEPSVTGSRTNLRMDEIAVLPATDIWDVLALQQGFMQLPPNTDIIAYTDTRRNPKPPVRVRGGRAGETQMLLDGFPVNNVVFGGPAFDISLEAVQQIDYQRGSFDVQYGNAMSGIVNVATREGGTRFTGALSYQTSAVSGALGNTPDELAGFGLLQGHLSGPIPGTRNALRLMVAGRLQVGADRVLQFDDRINRPSILQGGLQPEQYDLIPGWRAFGYDNLRDLTAKLTYYVQPMMKLSLQYTGYLRQRLPYDFDYLLTGFDYLETPAAGNYADSVALLGLEYWLGQRWDQERRGWLRSSVFQASLRTRRDVLFLQWDHMISGRWSYRVQGGWYGEERDTCSFFQGLCLGDRLAGTTSTPSGFYLGWDDPRHPASGTDDLAGGETVDTYVGRIDLQGQVTDNHQLRFGALYQRHRLTFTEFRDRGACCLWVVPSGYGARPWEGAVYAQDRMETDWATIKLGLRYDFGRSGGIFFANPLDPTNGTTAREICDGTLPGVSEVPWTNGQGSGIDACLADPVLLDSATALAQFDDFADTQGRGQLSPRIGVSVPFSERSHVFFNFGQYSQHPLYNVSYQGTGIGTIAGDTGGGICEAEAVVPDTDQCHPALTTLDVDEPYVGNPNQRMERTTSYEMGFATEIADDVALQVVAFAGEQSGLSGLGRGGVTAQGTPLVFDPGNTYGAARYDSLRGYWYDYPIVVNRDHQITRGLEVSLRRRLVDFWGASVNYTVSQTTMNAAAPDLEQQWRDEEGGTVSLREIPSEIDRPHVLNATVFFRVGNEDAFHQRVLDAMVRDGQLSFTFQVASGVPYTPIGYASYSGTGYYGTRRTRNGERGPSTLRIDAFAAKDFLLANLRLGVFLRVANLLDQRDCRQVYASTGVCDTGVDDPRRRRASYTTYPTTSTYFDRPHYYGSRRSFNFGLQVRF
jgi:Carboxypeptidase regulatory-like domain/TonB-dependent Receptor Plug Domain